MGILRFSIILESCSPFLTALRHPPRQSDYNNPMPPIKPFLRAHWPSLLVAVLINAVILTNALLHHPKIGYDVTEHLNYIQVMPLRLPTPADTSEFFSAPLPYLLPSLFDKLCTAAGWPNCRALDGKTAQAINFLLSLAITALLWKLAERLKPGSESFKVSTLSLLGVLTVYYKTFSQARGEPYVAFFVVLAVYLLMGHLQRLERLSARDGTLLGVVLGLLVLSRQWGFLLFPALAVLLALLLLKNWPLRARIARFTLTALLVAFAVGGWFYLHLYFTYGSFTTFNLQSVGPFSFSNQPQSFYRYTYLENFDIFREPVRPNFGNTLYPIFYSETWGDYWGYLTFISQDNPYVNLTENRAEVAPYLGRVNLVSVFPTLLLLAGLLWGAWHFAKAWLQRNPAPDTILYAFALSVVVFSWVGYLWFLVSYPSVNPVNLQVIPTNKATYLIQVFMLLPVLGASLLEKLKSLKPALYWLLLAGLALVFAHNLPALITRYIWAGV